MKTRISRLKKTGCYSKKRKKGERKKNMKRQLKWEIIYVYKKTREEHMNKQKETKDIIENQHAMQVETIIQRVIKKKGE